MLKPAVEHRITAVLQGAQREGGLTADFALTVCCINCYVTDSLSWRIAKRRQAVLPGLVFQTIKPSSETGGVETQTEKQVVKLTLKALADKLERLQEGRKTKLNKATNIRKSMQSLMLMGDKKQVQNALEELINVCDEAKYMHESLLGLLPCDEKDKHVTWFNAKMLGNNECIAGQKRWFHALKVTHMKMVMWRMISIQVTVFLMLVANTQATKV